MTPFPESAELRTVGFLREEIQRSTLPTPSRAWLCVRRRGLIASLVSALAAIPATILIMACTASTPAGYDVIRHPDGRVTVTLNLASSISALNARMKGMGLAVRAVPVAQGCRAETLTARRVTDRRSLTLSPPSRRGRTLILATGRNGFSPVPVTVMGPSPVCVGMAG